MKVTLVIPCYNEEHRLNLRAFQNSEVNFLFVNDGSTDDTERILRSISSDNHKILSLSRNRGKAEAVRVGILEALKEFPDSEWIGFWDSDLATPLDEVQYMLKFDELYSTEYKALIGSRVLRLGSEINRSFVRHILGRLFVTYSSILLESKAYDSQCGAKIFRREVIQKIFQEPFISKWIFDLEILKRMDKFEMTVLECPLQAWNDVGGSKINIFTDGLRAFWEVLIIRNKYGKRKIS